MELITDVVSSVCPVGLAADGSEVQVLATMTVLEEKEGRDEHDKPGVPSAEKAYGRSKNLELLSYYITLNRYCFLLSPINSLIIPTCSPKPALFARARAHPIGVQSTTSPP